MSNFHKPVLLEKVIDLLQIKKDKKYIDATLGGAGHTSKILSKGGSVLAIDMDDEAIQYVKSNFQNRNLILLAVIHLFSGFSLQA